MDQALLRQAASDVELSFVTLAGNEILAAPRPPFELYHYTSAEGLKGILQSGKLWATNVLYLNDAMELADSISVLQTVLADVKISDELDFYLKTWIPPQLENLEMDFFVACFCEEGDLLSQWRGYATRMGYSIGFNTSALIDVVNANWARFHRIEYDPARKADRIKARCDELAKVLAPIADQLTVRNDQDVKDLANFLSKIAVLFTPDFASMKHSTFAEEHEWRLVLQQPRRRDAGCLPLEFRISDGKIVPYVSLQWTPETSPASNAIASVRHGPVSEPLLAKRALSDLLAECDCEGVEVLGSSIPLRA